MIKFLRGIFNGLKSFFNIIAMLVQYLGKGLSFLWAGVEYIMALIADLPPWIKGIAAIVLVLAIIKLILGR